MLPHTQESHAAGQLADAIFGGRKVELAVQGTLRKLRNYLARPSNNCAPGEEMGFSDPRLGPGYLLGWLQANHRGERVHHGLQLLAAAKALVRTVDECKAFRAFTAPRGDGDGFGTDDDDDDELVGPLSREELDRRTGLKAVRLIRVLLCIRSTRGRFLGLPLAAVAVSRGLSVTGGLNGLHLFLKSPLRSMLYSSYDKVISGYIEKTRLDIHNSPKAHIVGCDNFNIQSAGVRQGAFTRGPRCCVREHFCCRALHHVPPPSEPVHIRNLLITRDLSCPNCRRRVAVAADLVFRGHNHRRHLGARHLQERARGGAGAQGDSVFATAVGLR